MRMKFYQSFIQYRAYNEIVIAEQKLLVSDYNELNQKRSDRDAK